MNVLYFDDISYESAKNCPIYVINLFWACIDDLCATYQIHNKIRGIIDDKVYARYRSIVVDNVVIPVMSTECIDSLSDDAILIVAGGDYKHDIMRMSKNKKIIAKYKSLYFWPNREGRNAYHYYAKFNNFAPRNVIVFRNGIPLNNDTSKGWIFSDNVRALFEYMIHEKYNEKYTLVGIVNDTSRYKLEYKNIKNVVFLPAYAAMMEEEEDKKQLDEYYYWFTQAKYIFFTHGWFFTRFTRPGQIRVNLWHGCGFKSNNVEPEATRYEYMTVTSDMYSDLHAKSFGLHDKQMLVTGLPKDDWLFCPRMDWKKIFRIPEADRYIFWLPTWRTRRRIFSSFSEEAVGIDIGLPILYTEDEMENINNILKALNAVIILKPHADQDINEIARVQYSNVILLRPEKLTRSYIDINQILGNSDALISDYSSVATGYMLLDRPMAFTLDDIDLYHGFHWSKEELHNWLPGEEIYDYDDFVRFIKDVAVGRDTSKGKRHRLMPYFHKYTDGNSCERVLKALGITKD